MEQRDEEVVWERGEGKVDGTTSGPKSLLKLLKRAQLEMGPICM